MLAEVDSHGVLARDNVFVDKYGKLGAIPTMRRNELQALRTAVAAQEDVIENQQQRINAQSEEIAGLAQRLARLESLIGNK